VLRSRRGSFARAIAVAALLAPAIAVTVANAQTPVWHAAQPIPQGANEVIGTALDDAVFVYGGQIDGTNVPQGLFFMFRPSTGSWTRLPSNPVPVHHAALVAVGQRVYLIGGFMLPWSGPAAWMPVRNVWSFDLLTQRWSALAPMPTARGALAAVVVDNKIYAIGGATLPCNGTHGALLASWANEESGATEEYDIASNTWRVRSPMLTARNHLGAAAIGRMIYAVGGRTGSAFSGGASSNISANEAYDIANDRWEPRAPLPTPRSGLGVVAVGGRVHALGGEGYIGDFGGTFRTHESYDPQMNTWRAEERMPTPRHGFAIAVVAGSVYAISGRNVPGGGGPAVDLTVNEVFDDAGQRLSQ